jgi:hypothetical protein
MAGNAAAAQRGAWQPVDEIGCGLIRWPSDEEGWRGMLLEGRRTCADRGGLRRVRGDAMCEGICAASRPPVVEGIGSQRGLEWRCTDSFSRREFLRLSGSCLPGDDPGSCCAQYAIVEYWRCHAYGPHGEFAPLVDDGAAIQWPDRSPRPTPMEEDLCHSTEA